LIPGLRQAALNRVQATLNRALRHDPGTRQSLGDLAGRCLAVTVTLPPLELAVRFTEDGELRLTGEHPEAPDTNLEGTAAALVRLATDTGDRVSFAGTGVIVAGDQDLLRHLKGTLRHLDIDWEEALAELLGDVPAHLIGRGLRGGLRWGLDAGQRVRSGLGEYVREEARLTPGRAELENWIHDVGALSLDTERLAARLDRLRRRLDDTGDNRKGDD
jgi:ubiquinone biosynthesis protein UbiJ